MNFCEHLYTVKEASVITDRPIHKLYAMIRSGCIKVVRMGTRRTTIPHSELERIIGLDVEEANQLLRDSLLWPPIPEEESFDFETLEWGDD